MKCEICHKRDATTAYTHIVDDEKKTLLLCEVCMAEEKGSDMPVEPKSGAEQKDQKEVPVLIKEAKVEFSGVTEAPAAGHCAGCGMTYEQFKKAGRLGCSACYETFAPQMQRLLKRIHGADEHCGKGRIEPGQVPLPDEELEQLRQDLQAAVAKEDFEQAAQLRDDIRRIESSGDTGR